MLAGALADRAPWLVGRRARCRSMVSHNGQFAVGAICWIRRAREDHSHVALSAMALRVGDAVAERTTDSARRWRRVVCRRFLHQALITTGDVSQHRTADRRVERLIRQWLEAQVVENGIGPRVPGRRTGTDRGQSSEEACSGLSKRGGLPIFARSLCARDCVSTAELHGPCAANRVVPGDVEVGRHAGRGPERVKAPPRVHGPPSVA